MLVVGEFLLRLIAAANKFFSPSFKNATVANLIDAGVVIGEKNAGVFLYLCKNTTQ